MGLLLDYLDESSFPIFTFLFGRVVALINCLATSAEELDLLRNERDRCQQRELELEVGVRKWGSDYRLLASDTSQTKRPSR